MFLVFDFIYYSSYCIYIFFIRDIVGVIIKINCVAKVCNLFVIVVYIKMVNSIKVIIVNLGNLGVVSKEFFICYYLWKSVDFSGVF